MDCFLHTMQSVIRNYCKYISTGKYNLYKYNTTILIHWLPSSVKDCPTKKVMVKLLCSVLLNRMELCDNGNAIQAKREFVHLVRVVKCIVTLKGLMYYIIVKLNILSTEN